MSLTLRAAALLASTRGLRRHALLPLLISALIYAAALGVFFWLVARQDVHFELEFWGSVGAWTSTALNWSWSTLKWIVAVPVALIASYFSFVSVGMVITAPLAERLSARVEHHLCGESESPSGGLRGTILGMVDAAAIALRQLFWLILALPLCLVPVVGFVPLLLVLARFTGLGSLDVASARNGLRLRRVGPVLRELRWELLGIGIAMELLFLVPFLGLLLFPIGTVAGTILYCETDWNVKLARHRIETPRGFVAPRASTSDH